MKKVSVRIFFLMLCGLLISCSGLPSEQQQMKKFAFNYLERLYKLDYAGAAKYATPDFCKQLKEAGEGFLKLKISDPGRYQKLLDMNKEVTLEWKNIKFTNADSTRATVHFHGSKGDKGGDVPVQMQKIENKWYVNK